MSLGLGQCVNKKLMSLNYFKEPDRDSSIVIPEPENEQNEELPNSLNNGNSESSLASLRRAKWQYFDVNSE